MYVPGYRDGAVVHILHFAVVSLCCRSLMLFANAVRTRSLMPRIDNAVRTRSLMLFANAVRTRSLMPRIDNAFRTRSLMPRIANVVRSQS